MAGLSVAAILSIARIMLEIYFALLKQKLAMQMVGWELASY